MPLDRLKIDRTFVVEALVNPRCAAVIRAAARIAKELGLALTGEGVESCEQFELLRSAGCDETQGYFHSRPLPESELAAVFERSPGGCDARSDCRHLSAAPPGSAEPKRRRLRSRMRKCALAKTQGAAR